jgi:predicted secreted acid phosphatase
MIAFLNIMHRLAFPTTVMLLSIGATGFNSRGGLADEACPDRYLPPSTRAELPVNIGQLKAQLKTYKRCAYLMDVERVLVAAKDYISARAPVVTRPALVLDIDETALSNWPEIEQNDFAYFPTGPCSMEQNSPCGDRDWELSAHAAVIPPTLELFNAAKDLGVAVFFVTGRQEEPKLREATARNLSLAGYFGWSGLVMRAAAPDCNVACYKTGARAKIVAEGYAIIANVGDQESDLAGEYAERVFKVPNPFYFIP